MAKRSDPLKDPPPLRQGTGGILNIYSSNLNIGLMWCKTNNIFPNKLLLFMFSFSTGLK